MYSKITGTEFPFKKATYAEVLKYQNNKNRLVRDAHSNEFYEFLRRGVGQDGTAFGPYPIHINVRTQNILDGQHRRAAYLKAIEKGNIAPDTPIWVAFEDIPEEEERARVIELNTHSLNWQLDDYVKSLENENEHYRRLIQFCESHELCCLKTKTGKYKCKYIYAATILKGKEARKTIKRDDFSLSDAELIEGDKIHNELVEIRKILAKQKGVEYEAGTYHDIETMAKVWRDMREFISVDDIRKTRIPSNILNQVSKGKKEWDSLFQAVYFNVKTHMAA